MTRNNVAQQDCCSKNQKLHIERKKETHNTKDPVDNSTDDERFEFDGRTGDV